MILDKAKMAHDWVMKYGKVDSNYNRENTVQLAWEYADAMQDEEDKRVVKLPDVFFDVKTNEEWQPDWSQAPEWANWWAMDMDKNCYWYEDKLHLGDVEWDRHSIGRSFKSKPYGYTGNWQDSLRKRPQ